MHRPAAPASASPTLVELAAEAPGWRELVAASDQATPFHHPAWAATLAACYGYAPSVLSLTAGDRLLAGLPVLTVSGRFRARRAVALPFTDHCTPLAVDEDARARLPAALVDWAQGTGTTLEMRGDLGPAPGITRRIAGVRHLLRLERDPDRMLGLFDRNVRQRLRKLARGPLEAQVEVSRASLDAFYRLHLRTRRRLGVPIQPRHFFELVWERVLGAGLGYCVVARLHGRPVAAAVFLAWNRSLVYKYSASDPEHWRLAPNHLLIWTAIQAGCREGRQHLDFGRTELDNAGLRTFKSEWGADEMPLFSSAIGTAPSPGPAAGARRLLAATIRVSPPVVCRLTGELLYRYFP